MRLLREALERTERMDSDRLLVGQGDPFLEMGADSALEWLIELILD